MASSIAANKAELLAIANAVATEKMIDKSIVIEALEEAIQRAARARYGAENDIRAKLDTQTGDLRLWRVVEVVENVEDYFKQVDLKQADKLQKGAVVGDFIVDPLPAVDLGRIDAQSAKQVIFQKVRDAERERQFEEFKDRTGEIITGVVKSVEFGHVVVDLGRAEGVIRRDQQIPREVVRGGDRVRALIMKVQRENRGPQILLSRAHPDFMKKLFAQEVPEIYDGVIEIKAAARDPGSRAKIGVISHDSSIDPVGACVGMKGSRVQAVVQEMQGEKIDIIPWSEDTATFIVNALQPATVSRVVIDEEEGRIEVVVPDDATSDEVVELLTGAGITSSAVIADVAGNSCSGFTNWVNSLTTQPVVLAVDACALSNSKRETENWFVARYGNDFTNDRDAEFGLKSWVSSYREGIRAAVLAVVDLLSGKTERNLSLAEVKAGLNSSVINVRGFSQAPQCALVLSYVALCTSQVGLSQVKNGELVDVRGGAKGNPIKLFTEIQPLGS